MPWTPKDATSHTKKANTPAKQKQWSTIADRLLAAGKSDAQAIRIANGVIKKRGK